MAETRNNSTMERMVAAAKDGVDPVEAGEAIHAADDELPVDMVVGRIKNAGHVVVYNMDTGRESQILKSQLIPQLKKRNADGHFIFSTDPADAPTIQKGTLMCPLHPDAEGAEAYHSMGMPKCRKTGIKSVFSQERHLRTYHKNSYNVIQREEERRREAKRDERDTAMVQAIQLMVERMEAGQEPVKEKVGK